MRSDDRSGRGRRDLDAALASREQCIAVERLASELDGQELEHVASCARCRTELALYRDFENDAASAEERAASEWIVARLRRGRAGASMLPRRWSFGLAAAALLTVGIGLLARSPAPRLHEPPVESNYRSTGLRPVSPKGDLASAPIALEWESVPGAERYETELLAVDRQSLWRGSTREPRTQLPSSVQRLLVPGKTVLWRVTAYDAAGGVLGTSDLERFRVTPSSASP